MEEANSPILIWTQPEYPYRVSIPAPLLNGIRILAVEAFYSVPRGGVEIGGVFFGVRHRSLLEIRAHRPIRCQYATGPSFTLSVNDQLGLAGLLEQAAEDPDLVGLVPLGWYHSHTRSEIFLSPADLALYNEFFPERWHVALVLRPANLQPTRGGFFYRDRMGAIKSDAPLQEFKLEPPNFGLTPLEGDRPEPVQEEPPNAEPMPAARTRPIGRLIPIREPEPVREQLAVAEVRPAEPPPVAPVPAPPNEALVAAASGNGAGGTMTAMAPAPEVERPLPEPIPFPPPAHKADSGQPDVGLPRFLAEGQPAPPRRTGWIWTLLFLTLLSAGGAFAFWKWGQMPFNKSGELGLETYDINGSFLIRWDRESKALRSATRATIEIQDGADKTPIELTGAELSRGGYGWIRRTGQVSVHMKVEGETPVDEYSNFNSAESLGSQQIPASESAAVQKAITEKEHLKTELINESMQSLELRQQITDLKRQLAEERAKNAAAQKQAP